MLMEAPLGPMVGVLPDLGFPRANKTGCPSQALWEFPGVSLIMAERQVLMVMGLPSTGRQAVNQQSGNRGYLYDRKLQGQARLGSMPKPACLRESTGQLRTEVGQKLAC